MGFLIKFFLFFIFIYLLLKGLAAFITGGKRSGKSTSYYRQQRQRPEQPETQEDRIIEYQKKSFETTEAEDADFIEIKDK